MLTAVFIFSHRIRQVCCNFDLSEGYGKVNLLVKGTSTKGAEMSSTETGTNKTDKQLADFYWSEWLKVDNKMKIFGKTPKIVAEESRLWDLFMHHERLAGN